MDADKHAYLLINGLRVSRAVPLGNGLTLMPISSLPSPELVLHKLQSAQQEHLVSLYFPQIESQLKVTGVDERDIAIRAWNAIWAVLLLSAIFNSPASSPLRSNQAMEHFGNDGLISLIDHALHGYGRGKSRLIDENESLWLEQHFVNAQILMDDDRFQTAVHCLSTFHWHSHPRARLALIWAGIESLFGVDSEIVFRVSLYIAKFLAPTLPDQQLEHFNQTKRLYKIRSQAVHGGKMKGDPHEGVNESATLLHSLIVRCVENRALPDVSKLAF